MTDTNPAPEDQEKQPRYGYMLVAVEGERVAVCGICARKETARTRRKKIREAVPNAPPIVLINLKAQTWAHWRRELKAEAAKTAEAPRRPRVLMAAR